MAGFDAELAVALTELEGALETHAPLAAASLRPGRSAEELRVAAANHGFELCDSVLTLFAWHDGCDEIRGPYRGQLFPGGGMLSSAESLGLYGTAMEQLSADGWDRSWFPLFRDGQTLVYVVRLGDDDCGELLSFDYVELSGVTVEHRSLVEWARATARRFRLGAYRPGAYGTVDPQPGLLAQLMREESRCDVDRLVDALGSEDESEWSAALSDLRRHQHPEAVPGLVEILTGTRPGSACYAAELLGIIGDPAAAAPLQIASRQDPHEQVREIAGKSLEGLTGGR
ncbi:MAG: HEAT repeat domain-containing protein [Candidatus Dormibacteraeota bacterium]|nr:HEAT repeat domain-containing protein [Candidatus Dormibacteraeota bacterium]